MKAVALTILIFLGLTAYADESTTNNSPNKFQPFTAFELWEVGKILQLQFQIPGNLEKGEHMGLLWDITDKVEAEQAIMKRIESGVSFDEIPGGTCVKLFLWMDEFLTD